MSTLENLSDADLHEAIGECDVAKWGGADIWLVSVDGNALTCQPKTRDALEQSGRFHGPFATERDALEWAYYWMTYPEQSR